MKTYYKCVMKRVLLGSNAYNPNSGDPGLTLALVELSTLGYISLMEECIFELESLNNTGCA